jgi:hypothetical protein
LQVRGINALRIAFMITDGVPSNNFANTGGNPAWWWHDSTIGYNPAFYSMRIVPERANLLKDAGNRLFLVGVPDVNNVPPQQAYFNGDLPQNSNQCVRRANKNFCTRYNKPPFPIPSLPVNKNSFSTNTWNLQQLITQTVGALCEVLPTQTPTQSPTTVPPTNAPTVPAPTSRSPTIAPTSAPTNFPTSTAPTTPAPTTIPPIEQVDVTFIIDRSRSMQWHNNVCKDIVASLGLDDPNAPKSYCWELYMKFILDQADDLVRIKAGQLQERNLGWADDFPGSSNPARGLRINIVGFACANNQRTPRVYAYTRKLNGGPITSRAKLIEILGTLRTTVTPNGGTCPGLAIEQAVQYIENSPANDYPLQSVIL